VALALVARRGERFRASAFFSRRPRVSPSGATDGSQLVVPGADRIQAQLAPGTLASGERARLWRVDFRLRARTDRRIGLRFLGTGCT
jgi:hypothetical protein